MDAATVTTTAGEVRGELDEGVHVSPHTIDVPLVFDDVGKVSSFAEDGPGARELAGVPMGDTNR